MKVVFLSQRVPYPPDRGDRITTWHVLDHLLRRGAQVRVGCLADDTRDSLATAELAKKEGIRDVSAPRIHRTLRKLTSMRALFTGQPLTLPFFHSPTLASKVQAWFEEDPPDVVHVYSSSMAQYALPHQAPLRIMQFAELDSDKWRQYAAHTSWPLTWIYRREAVRLLEYEREVARTFEVSLVCSETEKSLFMEHIPDVTPTVLPNGVDTHHFQSQGDSNRQAHTLIFTGVMDYEPNVQGMTWFVDNCWPQIRSTFPDANLLIVGSRPVASIRSLDSRNGIQVTGRVLETPTWFDRAAVAIAPLHLARGIQNKVLEAMSMGLPVVATQNAAQGLNTEARNILLLADTPTDTVAAIQRLFENPDEARDRGQQAAAFVRSSYTWEQMLTILDGVLDSYPLVSTSRNSTGT